MQDLPDKADLTKLESPLLVAQKESFRAGYYAGHIHETQKNGKVVPDAVRECNPARCNDVGPSCKNSVQQGALSTRATYTLCTAGWPVHQTTYCL